MHYNLNFFLPQTRIFSLALVAILSPTRKRKKEIFMKEWKEMIFERLDAAYNARFEKDQALIFLNDAYQDALFWKMEVSKEESQEFTAFMQEFMAVRDLFISLLVDRYPSNYREVEAKLENLRNGSPVEVAFAPNLAESFA